MKADEEDTANSKSEVDEVSANDKKIVSPIFPLWENGGHRANLSSRHHRSATAKPPEVKKLKVPSILNNTELQSYFDKTEKS